MSRMGGLEQAGPVVGEGIQFKLAAKCYDALVLTVRPAAQDPEHGTTHLIRYSADSSSTSTEWVCLDGKSQTLSDTFGHEDIPYDIISTKGLWFQDVAMCTNHDMTTTGGQTWSASFYLCDYLELAWSSLGLSSSGSILELGSGAGWLGMTLARNIAVNALPGAVQLTEQPGSALEWLDENHRRNSEAGLPVQSVSTAAMDWAAWLGDDKSIREAIHAAVGDVHRFDLLIGADIIYDEAGVTLLPKAFRWFLQQNKHLKVLCAHKLNRYPDIDAGFFQRICDEGLDCCVLAAERAGLKGLQAKGTRSFCAAGMDGHCRIVLQVFVAGAD